ncbi:Hypothetical predicted protein [Cloeon dipterum]|uniref:Nuclear receptor 2C2-associated protein n=1 Tax=Cloeon dipterum TaxID=197152 RepID=A0A8S1E2L1_9INSE|nr:Hypothetical predicted protein [Cloeon dipterum]
MYVSHPIFHVFGNEGVRADHAFDVEKVTKSENIQNHASQRARVCEPGLVSLLVRTHRTDVNTNSNKRRYLPISEEKLGNMSNVLTTTQFNCRVSSTLNRNVKEYGKKFMFDGQEDTCWNSDQVPIKRS